MKSYRSVTRVSVSLGGSALILMFSATLSAPPLYADLIAVFDASGRPIAPGGTGNLPAGGHWEFFKFPGIDLAYQIFVVPPPPVPPPPPPPQTYRVVQPNNVVYDLGDGKKPKIKDAKQVGKQAVFTYDDDETVKIDGTLLKPGDPNPAPTNGQGASFDGPESFFSPALALQETMDFLTEPGVADMFPNITDLSFFQYDFNGTTPLPLFKLQENVTYSDGTQTGISIVPTPEPATCVLCAASFVLLCMVRRIRRLRRSLPATADHRGGYASPASAGIR
jgi:hypothetical protein